MKLPWPINASVQVLQQIVAAVAAGWHVEHSSDGTHNWNTVARPFAATTFTGNGSMTWTPDGADVTQHEYGVLGDRMLLAFHITGSDVGGTANSELRVGLPAGYVTTGWAVGSLYYSDAGGALETGAILASSGERWVSLYKSPVANWTLTTSDNTRVIGSILLRVARG